MDYLTILRWLVVGHFLFDFPLQNDYLAINKSPIINGKSNEVWIWCMAAHSALHTIPVMWLFGDLRYALIILITHFIIDYVKCKRLISFNVDQLLHLGVLAVVAAIAY